MKHVRWSDEDHHFGPFTFSMSSWWHWAMMACSAGELGCGNEVAYFRITAGKLTFIVRLPNWLIRPYVERKTFEVHESEGGPRSSSYLDIDRREFGWSLNDGHLSIHYGRQSDDSSTERSWGCFLPWTQWRHVRYSLYDLEQRHFWTQRDDQRRPGLGFRLFDAMREAQDACPKIVFTFRDFDGEALKATVHVEEREWRFGTGWFKWLSWFRKPMIKRSLSIDFSGETGRRKGSWKGGTIGHSIEMFPDDTHLSAFLRYCREHEMTWIGWEHPSPVLTFP